MVWRRNSQANLLARISLLVMVLAFSLYPISAQHVESETFETEQWEEATEGLEYGDISEKEEVEIRQRKSFNLPELGQLGKTVLLAIIILLLVFLVARLLGNKLIGGKGKIKTERTYQLQDLEDRVEESDLEKYLRLALEKKDYTSAVRIYYLMIIQMLNEQQLITWKRDKTNFDYVREMRRHPRYRPFLKLTRSFEFIWYGERPIGEKDYNVLKPIFEKFISHIDNP